MIESIFEKCLTELDFSNESRAVRQFLQCVVSQLNVKHIVIDNKDELGIISVSFNKFIRHFKEVVLNIKQSGKTNSEQVKELLHTSSEIQSQISI